MAEPAENQSEPGVDEGAIHDISLHDTIDGFQVRELLHESAMATIYRVSHADHSLPLIMKVPKLDITSPAESYSGFETELRILSRLRGSYTPRFIAGGDMTRNPYIVMEYIEGDELQQAVKRAPLSPDELCRMMVPVCRAVHELHRHNIIHLDLKPANVLNRANGKVVLIDFGIAHHTHLPDMIDAVRSTAPGTVAYLAPEQIHHVRHDSRSDIYAIGVMLYELATGKLPFGQPNLLSLRKRLYLPPVPPRALNPAIPPWLQEVILCCLEIHPDNRYMTAKEIAHRLLHPESVHLTERASRTRRARMPTILRLWLKSLYQRFDDIANLHPYERTTKAPHILVAVDPAHSSRELKHAIRHSVRKFIHNEPRSYFTVLSVVEGGMPSGEDILAIRHAPSVQRQMEMRHWMQPLKLARSRVNYLVVTGDPAAAIIDYARKHSINHIIMGARGSSTLRRLLGSVSTRVVAEANCTVTVVRSRRDTQRQQEAADLQHK